jgi:hypothetical protein
MHDKDDTTDSSERDRKQRASAKRYGAAGGRPRGNGWYHLDPGPDTHGNEEHGAAIHDEQASPDDDKTPERERNIERERP